VTTTSLNPARRPHRARGAALGAGFHLQAHATPTGTRSSASHPRGISGSLSRSETLDVIVANAGICVPKAWDQVTGQIFDDTVSTNVTGTWNTVMAGAPHLLAPDAGVTEF
jgi:NAD(P)-dependent dehydrogenase (short-subunit alcohol dehydrogenase family)